MKVFVILICLVAAAFYVNAAETDVENIWAVVISSSAHMINYGDEANACHAYHVLINHGVLPEKIILLMYDDVANDPQNPHRGHLYNEPNGTDVYAGVKIDYRREDINAEVFLNVIKGNVTGNEGKGSGRVLESTSADNVFIYFTGHGDTGVIEMPSERLQKKQLDQALNYMHEKKMYNKLLFYLDSCHSGSMFEGLSPEMNIYAVTSASHDENSIMEYCDTPIAPHVCLSAGEFSINWMHDTERRNILLENVGSEVDFVINSTIQSHVSDFGNKKIRNDKVADYLGKEPYANFTFEDEEFLEQIYSSKSISRRDLYLFSAKSKMQESGASSQKIKQEMAKYYQKRAELKKFVYQAVKILSPHQKMAKKVMQTLPKTITQMDCHFEAFNAFTQFCAPIDINPYAMTFSSVISNLCDIHKNGKVIVDFFKKECKNVPRFKNVL